jgi:hypothetical protein
MDIIVRCCGERTEKKAIELAARQGRVHIVKTRPFGESIRQSYKLALTFDQKWIPMVDADVLLLENSLMKGLKYLSTRNDGKIFCLDGKTKDKIMRCTRRAGVHIYRRSLIRQAIQYIDNNQLKPESFVRRTMNKIGFKTVVGPVVFGYHDYEQYFHDLWRKGFAQSRKLARKIDKKQMDKRWKKYAKTDADYKVILAAHRAGKIYTGKIIIDKNIDFGADQGLKILGIEEKGKLE